MAEQQKSEDKKAEKKSWFGGLFGQAEKNINKRKAMMDEIIGDNTQPDSERAAQGQGRPQQSKKWVEE